MVHEWRNPDLPWLSRQAVQILTNWLRRDDRGLEWGSGRSTVWLAGLVDRMTSVEHDPQWHEKVKNELIRRKLFNVDYRLEPVDDQELPSESSPYLAVAAEFPPLSIDFALVDGLYRDRCAQAALELLKPGGLLIIDNAN